MNRQNGSPAAATPPEPKSQEHARGTKIPPTHWTRLNTSKTPEAFEFDSPLATPGRRETASCGFNAGHHAANRHSTPTSQSFTDIVRPKHTLTLPAPQNIGLGRQLPITDQCRWQTGPSPGAPTPVRVHPASETASTRSKTVQNRTTLGQ